MLRPALLAALTVDKVEIDLVLSFIRSSVANLNGAATVVGRFLTAGIPLMHPLSRILRLRGLALNAYFFISSTTKSSVDFIADLEQERTNRFSDLLGVTNFLPPLFGGLFLFLEEGVGAMVGENCW